jgi:hypothetical protein
MCCGTCGDIYTLAGSHAPSARETEEDLFCGRTAKAKRLRPGKGDCDWDSLTSGELPCLPLWCGRHADRACLERDDPHRGGRLPEVLLGAHLARGSAHGGTRGAQGGSRGSDDEGAKEKRLADTPFSKNVLGQRERSGGSPLIRILGADPF